LDNLPHVLYLLVEKKNNPIAAPCGTISHAAGFGWIKSGGKAPCALFCRCAKNPATHNKSLPKRFTAKKMMKILCFLLIIGATVNAQSLMDDEIFRINPAHDTVLTTNLGSQVSIPKAAFQDSLGNSIQAGIIEISIKEVANQKDMLLEGLSTNTKDGILISNGMIRIEAASNGQKIELAKDKAIGIKIPAEAGKIGMQVYALDKELKNWGKSDTPIQLDTCTSYRLNIITEEKTVTKAEFMKWKQAQKLKQQREQQNVERLFGGRKVEIGPIFSKKAYSIPTHIDTIWTCRDLDVSYYSFVIETLGWYNIDKLIKVQDPVNLLVNTNEDLDVFLLMRNENVSMRGIKTSNTTYEFKKVPGKTIATILAYRQKDATTVNVSVKTIALKGGKVELEPAQNMSIGEFRRMVKMMK
jgi:hypothetical protein